jgi:hypothetical protein
LALQIVKNSSKRLVRADLELLKNATEYLEVRFTRGSQHSTFERGFETLRTSVVAAANMERQAGGAKLTPSSNPRPGLELVKGNRDPLPFFGDQSLYLLDIAPESTTFGMGDDIPIEELFGAIGMYSFLEPMLDESLQPPR